MRRQDLDRGQRAGAELVGEDRGALSGRLVGDRGDAQVDAQLDAGRRQGEKDQQDRGGDGHPRVGENGAGPAFPAAGPSGRVRDVFPRPQTPGQCPSVDTLAERRQQRGQHRPSDHQRAQDHQHGTQRDAVEQRRVHYEQGEQGDGDDRAGVGDRAAARRHRHTHRVGDGVSAFPVPDTGQLLAEAEQDEEGVVDRDPHSDHRDDREEEGVEHRHGRQHGEDTEGGREADQSGDQGNERGDQGGQRDEQDQEGDRNADRLGPLHVGVLHLGQVVGRRRVPRQIGVDRGVGRRVSHDVLEIGGPIATLTVVAGQAQ
ncbi:hypothetical protein [Streptomyces sp. NPDC006997]|uniref:hypothetical protein n=1 Tax=Streptomyces sp. NPDC006997 TaxID=3155356 RepID=UPI0033DCE8BF